MSNYAAAFTVLHGVYLEDSWVLSVRPAGWLRGTGDPMVDRLQEQRSRSVPFVRRPASQAPAAASGGAARRPGADDAARAASPAPRLLALAGIGGVQPTLQVLGKSR